MHSGRKAGICVHCKKHPHQPGNERLCAECLRKLPWVTCFYCRLQFHKKVREGERVMCPGCKSHIDKGQSPVPCVYCTCNSAFNGVKCDRCAKEEKRSGAPGKCDTCKKSCAFPRTEAQKQKVAGMTLCFLCTFQYKLDNYRRRDETKHGGSGSGSGRHNTRSALKRAASAAAAAAANAHKATRNGIVASSSSLSSSAAAAMSAASVGSGSPSPQRTAAGKKHAAANKRKLSDERPHQNGAISRAMSQPSPKAAAESRGGSKRRRVDGVRSPKHVDPEIRKLIEEMRSHPLAVAESDPPFFAEDFHKLGAEIYDAPPRPKERSPMLSPKKRSSARSPAVHGKARGPRNASPPPNVVSRSRGNSDSSQAPLSAQRVRSSSRMSLSRTPKSPTHSLAHSDTAQRGSLKELSTRSSGVKRPRSDDRGRAASRTPSHAGGASRSPHHSARSKRGRYNPDRPSPPKASDSRRRISPPKANDSRRRPSPPKTDESRRRPSPPKVIDSRRTPPPKAAELRRRPSSPNADEPRRRLSPRDHLRHSNSGFLDRSSSFSSRSRPDSSGARPRKRSSKSRSPNRRRTNYTSRSPSRSRFSNRERERNRNRSPPPPSRGSSRGMRSPPRRRDGPYSPLDFDRRRRGSSRSPPRRSPPRRSPGAMRSPPARSAPLVRRNQNRPSPPRHSRSPQRSRRDNELRMPSRSPSYRARGGRRRSRSGSMVARHPSVDRQSTSSSTKGDERKPPTPISSPKLLTEDSCGKASKSDSLLPSTSSNNKSSVQARTDNRAAPTSTRSAGTSVSTKEPSMSVSAALRQDSSASASEPTRVLQKLQGVVSTAKGPPSVSSTVPIAMTNQSGSASDLQVPRAQASAPHETSKRNPAPLPIKTPSTPGVFPHKSDVSSASSASAISHGVAPSVRQGWSAAPASLTPAPARGAASASAGLRFSLHAPSRPSSGGAPAPQVSGAASSPPCTSSRNVTLPVPQRSQILTPHNAQSPAMSAQNVTKVVASLQTPAPAPNSMPLSHMRNIAAPDPQRTALPGTIPVRSLPRPSLLQSVGLLGMPTRLPSNLHIASAAGTMSASGRSDASSDMSVSGGSGSGSSFSASSPPSQQMPPMGIPARGTSGANAPSPRRSRFSSPLPQIKRSAPIPAHASPRRADSPDGLARAHSPVSTTSSSASSSTVTADTPPPLRQSRFGPKHSQTLQTDPPGTPRPHMLPNVQLGPPLIAIAIVDPRPPTQPPLPGSFPPHPLPRPSIQVPMPVGASSPQPPPRRPPQPGMQLHPSVPERPSPQAPLRPLQPPSGVLAPSPHPQGVSPHHGRRPQAPPVPNAPMPPALGLPPPHIQNAPSSQAAVPPPSTQQPPHSQPPQPQPRGAPRPAELQPPRSGPPPTKLPPLPIPLRSIHVPSAVPSKDDRPRTAPQPAPQRQQPPHSRDRGMRVSQLPSPQRVPSDSAGPQQLAMKARNPDFVTTISRAAQNPPPHRRPADVASRMPHGPSFDRRQPERPSRIAQQPSPQGIVAPSWSRGAPPPHEQASAPSIVAHYPASRRRAQHNDEAMRGDMPPQGTPRQRIPPLPVLANPRRLADTRQQPQQPLSAPPKTTQPQPQPQPRRSAPHPRRPPSRSGPPSHAPRSDLSLIKREQQPNAPPPMVPRQGGTPSHQPQQPPQPPHGLSTLRIPTQEAAARGRRMSPAPVPAGDASRAGLPPAGLRVAQYPPTAISSPRPMPTPSPQAATRAQTPPIAGRGGNRMNQYLPMPPLPHEFQQQRERESAARSENASGRPMPSAAGARHPPVGHMAKQHAPPPAEHVTEHRVLVRQPPAGAKEPPTSLLGPPPLPPHMARSSSPRPHRSSTGPMYSSTPPLNPTLFTPMEEGMRTPSPLPPRRHSTPPVGATMPGPGRSLPPGPRHSTSSVGTPSHPLPPGRPAIIQLAHHPQVPGMPPPARGAPMPAPGVRLPPRQAPVPHYNLPPGRPAIPARATSLAMGPNPASRLPPPASTHGGDRDALPRSGPPTGRSGPHRPALDSRDVRSQRGGRRNRDSPRPGGGGHGGRGGRGGGGRGGRRSGGRGGGGRGGGGRGGGGRGGSGRGGGGGGRHRGRRDRRRGGGGGGGPSSNGPRPPAYNPSVHGGGKGGGNSQAGGGKENSKTPVMNGRC